MFGSAIMGRKRPAEQAAVRRADILLAVSVLLAAGVLAFFWQISIGGRTAACAVIEQNGVEVGRLRLGTGDSLRVAADGGGYNLIEVTKDGVRVSEADCRDQICVRQGTITKSGETIICLPHKLAVRLEGAPEAGPDALTN